MFFYDLVLKINCSVWTVLGAKKKHNVGSTDIVIFFFLQTVENGDLNWIVPNKFLAFAGPQSKSHTGSSKSI